MIQRFIDSHSRIETSLIALGVVVAVIVVLTLLSVVAEYFAQGGEKV